MSESLRRKKKGIWSQGPFPLFFFKQNGTPSCKMWPIISYFSCNFQASSKKITQLPKSYVTSDKHNVKLI